VPEKRRPEVQLAWVNVTYRSVILAILGFLFAVGVAMHFAFPQTTAQGVEVFNRFSLRVLERLAGSAETGQAGQATAQQAHFTNLDGTVRVKKASSNVWVNAAYNLPLEKGDVVQTASEGIARVVFSDGTNYTLKQDSLIAIEDNSANDKQQTSVAVTVDTGTVDLSTGTYTQGSRSRVSVAGATASLAPESAAQVHNDPKADQHEILSKGGQVDVIRSGEAMALKPWEKATFQAESQHMAKVQEVGPPTPISPANMAPIFINSGAERSVEFSWTKMANAAGYRLRVSRNPYFSSVVEDRKIEKAEAVISLSEGAFYWTVQSYDSDGRESLESEKNRFTVIPRDKNVQAAMLLELEPFVQHGRVIEVIGKTEADARVMVNGREVPMLATDGSFRYFTPPLPNGESVITITAQNSKGGVNTQQKKIVIQ
jgi:hypothetical protein